MPPMQWRDPKTGRVHEVTDDQRVSWTAEAVQARIDRREAAPSVRKKKRRKAKKQGGNPDRNPRAYTDADGMRRKSWGDYSPQEDDNDRLERSWKR